MAMHSPPGSSGRTQAGRRRVLVVDDERDIREGVRNLLERTLENVDVFTAASGEQGLYLLRREPVDLILSDFKMPGMNGVEFLQEARTIAPWAPQVLVTAYTLEASRIRAELPGNATVLTKPLDPNPFLQACRRMLFRWRTGLGGPSGH